MKEALPEKIETISLKDSSEGNNRALYEELDGLQSEIKALDLENSIFKEYVDHCSRVGYWPERKSFSSYSFNTRQGTMMATTVAKPQSGRE